MIIAKPRWQKNYIDVLDRATTDGVTKPSYAQMIKHSGLIARHVRSGLWGVLDVYYNFRQDAVEAFNYYNWKTPASNKITKSGTTTFVSNTKVTFAGSGGYYNTNYNLASSTHYTNVFAGIGLGIVTNGNSFVFGVNASAVRYTFISTGNIVRVNSTGSMDVSPDTPGSMQGKWVVRRISSTQVSFNRNGVNDGTKNQNSDAALSSLSIYLGCRNNNGSANGGGAGELSYAWFGASISDTIALQAYNDETAFEASL